MYECVKNVRSIIICNNNYDYKNLDWDRIRKITNGNTMFDFRNILNKDNLKKRLTSEFNEYVEKAKEESIKNEKTNLMAVAINYIIQVLQLAILLLAGMFMISRGYILPGTFISVGLLSNNIRFAVRLLSDISLCWHEATVLCERVLEIFNIEPKKKKERILKLIKLIILIV